MTKVVALLPMKANSERVPGKNFRQFVDKPLFRWILDSLLAIPEIDQVVINTDARQTLVELGLQESPRLLIRDRKPELCGDFMSMNDVLKDDIENVTADIYLMTHTTNPMLSAECIGRALSEFSDLHRTDEIDSMFTVNRIQTRLYRENGSALNHEPDNLIRTQDLEPLFEENSCLYIFTAESFSAKGGRIGARPGMFITPKLEALDIDEPEDWVLAEAVAKYGKGCKPDA